MTADWRAPGPDRPTDPRDELVQALLGLRWALPRTDADARVALDQLSAVSARVAQLAGEQPGDETPWDGQVQALLAQAGFALDWWRPVLDDVDLDWTLNHQAHLSADLARIASAGARILDQFAPAVPNPAAAPPSAVTEGPPQAAPRMAAAFGSVPAMAIVDPLANSGRHRRPAYDFESFDALDAQPAGPQPGQPVAAEPDQQQQQQQPYLPTAAFLPPEQFAPPPPQMPSRLPQAQFPPPAQAYQQPPQSLEPQGPPRSPEPLGQLEPPGQFDPALEALFRPQEPARPAQGPALPGSGANAGAVPDSRPSGLPAPSDIFGPPALYAPPPGAAVLPLTPPPMSPTAQAAAAAAGMPAPQARQPSSMPPAPAPAGNPPPPAFSRAVLWGAGDGRDDEDEYEYDPIVRPDRRGSHTMVLQAVGILGAVAALSWWAVTNVHLGSHTGGNPAAATTTTAQAALPAPGAGAGTHRSTAPAAPQHPKDAPSPVTSVTTPPTTPPAPNAADVKALQLQLLGGSASQRQIALVMAVNTSGPGRVTVTVDYYGMKNGVRTDERTASWTLSGKTTYQVAAGIPSSAYCGEVFTLKAVSGDATATQTTNPGC